MHAHRFVNGTMHALGIVPVMVAGAILAGPVVKPDIDYSHAQDGPQFGHYFTAGTASALARPPGGYDHEQPIPSPAFRIISPA
jgi:hypothetical protein